MSNGTKSIIVLSDPAPWKYGVLSTVATTTVVIYLLVTVAIYRVSKNLHSFILFLSEAVANIAVLGVASMGNICHLLHAHLMGDPMLESVLVSACVYVAHLHYLLIAVNRACAIFFPLKYNAWWPRERVVASVAAVWLVGSALQLVNVVQYASIRATPLFVPIYSYVQRCVTLPSLCIYSSAVGWVLLSRLLQWIKRHRVSPAATSSASVNYGAMDLRIFAYCFASFLPNCYNMVVRPPVHSLHWLLVANMRIASPGLLLYLMSAVVREQMPRCGPRCQQEQQATPLTQRLPKQNAPANRAAGGQQKANNHAAHRSNNTNSIKV